MPDEKNTQQTGKQHEEATPVNDNIVQELLEQYHQLASKLRESSNRDQTALALAPLVNTAHADQIVYLKALGQQDSTDAADIAQAMYDIAPDKEARKEARRTLLRLEAQHIYPDWHITPEGLVSPPVIHLTPEDLATREQTDAQEKTLSGLDSLLQDLESFFGALAGPPTIEPVTALLESWDEGDPAEAFNALSPLSPLREDLAIDAWTERRTQWSEAAMAGPVKISYIGEKDKLAPDRVVVEATWSLPIGNPTAERPPKDLPTATCVLQQTGRHWFWTNYMVVQEDGAWHITDMTDEGALAFQLPATELEHHLREKVANAQQGLTLLADEEDEDVEDFDEDDIDFDEDEDFDEDMIEDQEADADADADEDSLDFLEEMEEVTREATLAMHYHDALIHQAPYDGAVIYQSAVECAQMVHDIERAAVYFQQMAQNIPEIRGKALRGLAIMYEQILQDYLADNPEDPEPEKQRYNTLIEETLRQSIASDQTTTRSHVLLADFLLRQNKNLDEAEMLLRKAQPDAIEDEDIVTIEAGLAQIALHLDRREEALQHYQKVASLDTDFPHIWFHIGSLQRQLGDVKEAIFNLRRSVKEEPDFTAAHIELSVIYSDQQQFNKARDVLRQALDDAPDSADLLAALSIVYAQSGDLHSAQRYLAKAETFDEQNTFVTLARAMLQAQKEQKSSAPRSTPKDRHQPKHHSYKRKKK